MDRETVWEEKYSLWDDEDFVSVLEGLRCMDTGPLESYVRAGLEAWSGAGELVGSALDGMARGGVKVLGVEGSVPDYVEGVEEGEGRGKWGWERRIEDCERGVWALFNGEEPGAFVEEDSVSRKS